MINGLVSIITINWNSLDHIDYLLNSIKSQTYKKTELILYDNGSTDGSLEYIIKEYPDIILFKNLKNTGFSKPINYCIKKSSGEYILILNTDIVIEPDFIERMIQAIQSDPIVGSVAPKIFRFKDKKKTEDVDCFSHFMRKDRMAMHLSQNVPNFRSDFYDKKRFCFGTPACAGMYKREMLDDIKIENEIFDEDFFAYWEDVDVDWRANLRGWKCIYNPDALAYHIRGGSGLKNKPAIASGHLSNRFFTMIKNDSFLSILKNGHLISMRTFNECFSLGKKNVFIVFIAFFKIIFLSKKMFKKRKVIRRHRKVNQKDMEIWFEDVDFFLGLKNKIKRVILYFNKIWIIFISSSTYKQIGLWRTLFYCLLALFLFYINKVILILYSKPFSSATLFNKNSFKLRQYNSRKNSTFIIPIIPDISHHFIYREIEELLKRKDYEVIAVTKGENRYKSKSIMSLLRKVTYLQDVSDIRFIGMLSLLYYQLKHPGLIIKLLDYFKKHGKNKKEKNPFNLSLFWDPCNPIRGLSLTRYLEKKHISYVHVFGSSTMATQMLVSHLILDIPFSITAYVDFDYYYPYKLLEEKFSIAKFIIVTTKYCKIRLNEYFNNRYSDKIFVIQSALDLERFIFPEEFKIDENINILAVGRLVEKKGFEYLIEACKILKENNHFKFKCNIIGDGHLKKSLWKRIKKNNLSDMITLTGGIPIDEVKSFYKNSTLLIHPGIETDMGDRDGIPNSIVEAMALGLPVITTNISGIPELVNNGTEAILVPQKDILALVEAIKKILFDKELRRSLIINGRKRIEEYADVRKTSESFYALLENK